MIALTKDDKKMIDKKIRACWRKKKISQHEAENIVFKMKYKNTPGSDRLNAYLCKYCGSYHTGKG